jgi:regulator of replication initiation timing
MQCHFWNNNIPLEIPVVRVMNTAHFMAAYMFTTTCSGDQLEYDALANMSLGCDKKLFKVAIIVLAAMLQRTEGFRAKACRNMLLENRSEDFEEGVSLYDQFLRSAEKRFAEEDFLIDTGAQIQRLQAENQQLITKNNQLTTENIQLKYTITTMEEKYQQINIGTQYKQENNHGTIYNGPVTINQYAAPQEKPQQVEDITPVQEVKTEQKQTLPFLVPAKLQELGVYTLEEFENKYREAVEGGANVLAPFLKKYRELQVLDMGRRNKKETFEELKAFFGDQMRFGYTNFVAYF